MGRGEARGWWLNGWMVDGDEMGLELELLKDCQMDEMSDVERKGGVQVSRRVYSLRTGQTERKRERERAQKRLYNLSSIHTFPSSIHPFNHLGTASEQYI